MRSNIQRNILIIVQNLAVPFDRRVWQEATSLQRAGFGVAVICPRKGIHSQGYEQLEGVDIYRYPLFYEAGKGAIGYFIEFAYCWLVSFLLAIRVYVHRPFHAIHACNPPDTYFALALCGAGVHWQEDWLEDFVQSYRTGRHRSDDPFAKMETHFIEQEEITLDRTVTRFACMKRRQGELFPTSLNWNVRGPKDPQRDE